MAVLHRAGRRVAAFVLGTYPGAPVDYLIAFGAVYAVMVVLVARNIMHGL